MAEEERIDEVLEVWFGGLPADGSLSLETVQRWFRKDEAFDRRLEERLGDLVRMAEEGELEEWRATTRGALALLILCDQLPRNIYRGSARAHALDDRALDIAVGLLDSGADEALRPIERAFVRLPLMHAEDRDVQKRSVDEFARLRDESPEPAREQLARFHDFAVRHAEIVERFGRYPHRNAILGRTSTPEEEAFLKEPGSSF